MKKNYKLVLPLAFLFFLSAGMLKAQNQVVSGKVTDAATGAPIPGVNILEKDTYNGTLTDVNGKFSIKVNENAVLIFSFVGFLTQEVEVGAQNVINVAMSPDIQQLQEIVVIGYGQQKKEDATGSVTAISAEDLSRGAPVTAADLLVGKAAGVLITTSGGQPGAGAKIRIRGGSSLRASNDPLIVIDGVPVDNATKSDGSSGISGMGNPLSTINPNDIETFTILKDASATAIYGSRASNGVIIITTKKGSVNQPLRINYNGYVTVNTIPNTIDVLSSDEFREMIAEVSPGGVDLLGNADTDWQEEIFHTSLGHNHNLSATGALSNIPYRVSVGYTDQDGILKTSEFKRTTASLALNPSFFDDHLKVNLNVKGLYNTNRFAETGAIGNAISFDPTQPIYREDDLFGGYFTWMSGENPNSVAIPNPLSQLYDRNDKSTVKRSIGNLKLDYKLHFFPDLRVNFNFGYDYSSSEGSAYVNENSNYSWTALDRGDGSNRTYSQEKKNELVDIYLNYVKEIEAISSRIDLMAGYSAQHFWHKDTNFESSADESVIYRNSVAYQTENNIQSVFGRLNYSLLDRYLFTFTVRQDGTSRFHEDNRWGTFPSAAFAWRIINEPFVGESSALSDLKLRLGYGVTGQQNINEGDYPYLARYTYGEDNVRYQFGYDSNGNPIWYTTLRAEGYNIDLKWEETTTYNIGLDYGFANGRISGSIDAYLRKTTDLLNIIPVAAGSNFTNQLLTNVGDLENRGIEFSINTLPISKEQFTWNIGFNASYNKNEITKLTLTDDPNYPGVYTGGVSGGTGNTIQIHSVGYPVNSFFVYEQVYDEEGNPIEGLYVDRNGDGQVTSDDRYQYKDPAPDVYMGFNSKIVYKNWDFSFAGHANLGNYVYNNVFSSYGFSSNMYVNGFLSNVVTNARESGFADARYLSDYYIKEASFLRMDNISLGYTFEDLLDDKFNARVYGTVQNAFVITNYEGLDPEVDEGRDSNVFPRPRVFMVGVNVNF